MLRKSEYLEAVEIFLSTHRQKKPPEFVHVFPRSARLRTVSEYPDEVVQELREMGFPEVLKNEEGRVYRAQNSKDFGSWLTCGTIAILTLGLLILGVIKLSEMIASLL